MTFTGFPVLPASHRCLCVTYADYNSHLLFFSHLVTSSLGLLSWSCGSVRKVYALRSTLIPVGRGIHVEAQGLTLRKQAPTAHKAYMGLNGQGANSRSFLASSAVERCRTVITSLDGTPWTRARRGLRSSFFPDRILTTSSPFVALGVLRTDRWPRARGRLQLAGGHGVGNSTIGRCRAHA